MKDLAGRDYWNDVWAHEAKMPYNPDALDNRETTRLLMNWLADVPLNGLVFEAGCADSIVLPYIKKLGFQTVGMDYSEQGCKLFAAASPQSEVHCCDIFDPPNHLLGVADAIYSLGLVEHFEDTASCVAALSRFLKPGGTMLTIIPNLHGSLGLLQKILNPGPLNAHVVMTPQQLSEAHRDMTVTGCGYLSVTGYGALNHGYKKLPRVIVAALARASKPFVAFDEKIRLPRSRMFSPHCFCIAVKN